MKKNLYLMLFAALIFALAGCGLVDDVAQTDSQSSSVQSSFFDGMKTSEESPFTFSYETESREWKRNEAIVIEAAYVYHGETPYSYSGSSSGMLPEPIIFRNEDGSALWTETSDCFRGGNYFTPDILTREIASEETVSGRDTILLPQDAPVGKYHLVLIFDGHYQLFENAIEVVE